MLIPQYKIELYKFLDNNTVSFTPVEITDALTISVRSGIKTRKDTFDMSFDNHKLNEIWKKAVGKGTREERFIRAGDNIKIYIWVGDQPTDLDSVLKMDGEVTSYSYTVSETSIRIFVKGANRTETLLSTLVPTSNTKEGSFNTSPKVIMQILNRIIKFNPTKKLSYALDTDINPDTGEYGKIQSVNSLGSAFETIAYHQNYKGGYEQIEELSGPEYTGDYNSGEYLFYIQYSPKIGGGYVNEVVWKSKSKTVLGSFEEGVDFNTYKIDYQIKDVINAMIVSAGQDCYGHGKTTYVINAESMGKYGAKWKFYPATNIIPDLIKVETSIMDAAGSTYDERYLPDTYPYDMHFDGRDTLTGSSVGSKVIVTSDKEFNDSLRFEGMWQAKNEAQRIVNTLGSPRYQVNLDVFDITRTYQLGDLYELKIPSFGWEGTSSDPVKKLRLIEDAIIIGANGLEFGLTFEEDEKTIGVI